MSFYRKYRPQKFSDLVGQEHVKKSLTNAISQNKVGHAYLFSGPRGVGKTTVARLLAKSLNCENIKSSEPCGKCSSCTEIAGDKSLDVIEIDAASNRGIDEIRELKEKIKFAPSKSKYKVFIIDEVHMLTKEAFNALLKTLEEPPKHAIFIMATTELHKIPPTILSRVQQFDFKRASIENITNYLQMIVEKEAISIEKDALQLLAIQGDGSHRDATSILDQVAASGFDKISLSNAQEILGLSDEETIISFLHALADNDGEKALNIINNLFSEGYDLLEFNNKLIEYLRKLLIFQTNNDLLEETGMTKDQKKVIGDLVACFEKNQIIKLLKLFIEAGQNIKSSSLPQLPLEMIVMEVCDKSFEPSDVPTNKSSKPDQSKASILELDHIKPKVYEARINNNDKKIVVKTEEKKFLVDTISLKEKWPELLKFIQPENHSLFMILKESEPLRIENEKLVLGVKFKFFAERINDSKNYDLINQIVKKVYGQPIQIECIVDEKIVDQNNGHEEPSSLVNDAMEVFS